ncbi:MAG: hypothetical protein DMG59_27740 [Acidobacteria bacterium]|nr:MAG: hypothetical protein DMG59_27740 [Acidobacteriota bacterium]
MSTVEIKLSLVNGPPKTVRCDPSRVELDVGDILHFRTDDSPVAAVNAEVHGVARFDAHAAQALFEDFLAVTSGEFRFGATLTLKDGTVVLWKPNGGGDGIVH